MLVFGTLKKLISAHRGGIHGAGCEDQETFVPRKDVILLKQVIGFGIRIRRRRHRHRLPSHLRHHDQRNRKT